MSVSNYLAKTSNGCSYHYNKLKNEIYLVSEEHLKKIYIDNGSAYISGLTESPLKIEGFNISFKEETSLDERYKFQKTLTISVSGYATFEDFNDKYYAIIKTEDGTFYMINVDFPSKVTHTYNLSKNVNQTDFTLSSVSNFPALKLNNFSSSDSVSCKNYKINGVDGLRMLESAKVEFAEYLDVVYATEYFKNVEYLGDSLTFQESFDGNKFTTTVEFQIAFDAYKPSWHYNLLEFVLNKYAVIIETKNKPINVYAGFKNGLVPNYTINASTEKGQSNIVTISLVEESNNGLTFGSYGISIKSATHWRYISKIKNKKAYECLGKGVARYLLQEECDYYGNPTGNYKVLNGYQSLFYDLNIVGTFNETVTFTSPDCYDADCGINTNMPNTINFATTTCKTYTLSSTGNWNITNVPNFISVSPLSGTANSSYNISVCNTQTTSGETLEGYFTINSSCGNQLIINVSVGKIITEWRFFGNYYCVDGDKYKALEEAISGDGGNTWEKTGEAMIGDLVEEDSQWCEDNPPTYSWEITDIYECEG